MLAYLIIVSYHECHQINREIASLSLLFCWWTGCNSNCEYVTYHEKGGHRGRVIVKQTISIGSSPLCI
jgi:hypothetical protein